MEADLTNCPLSAVFGEIVAHPYHKQIFILQKYAKGSLLPLCATYTHQNASASFGVFHFSTCGPTFA